MNYKAEQKFHIPITGVNTSNNTGRNSDFMFHTLLSPKQLSLVECHCIWAIKST